MGSGRRGETTKLCSEASLPRLGRPVNGLSSCNLGRYQDLVGEPSLEPRWGRDYRQGREYPGSVATRGPLPLLDPKDKFLDVPSLFKALEQQKSTSFKRLVPVSFPVRPGGGVAPVGLREYLWGPSEKKSISYQMRDLEPHLVTVEIQAKQGLSHSSRWLRLRRSCGVISQIELVFPHLGGTAKR